MKHFSAEEHDVSQCTTKMMRIVVPGVRKPSSPLKKFLSLLWIIGALLVILVYIVIPMLIVLDGITSMLFELVFAVMTLFVAQLLVNTTLLKIAAPTRAPSVKPRPYVPAPHLLAMPQPLQATQLDTDGSSPALYLSLIPTLHGLPLSEESPSLPLWEESPSLSSDELLVPPAMEVLPSEAPFVITQRLRLPSRLR